MTPGRKIMNLRLDRGLSQIELAAKTGITCSAISKIEDDTNSPRAGTVYRIAQVLGATVEFLVDESMPYPYVPLKRPEVKHPTKMVRRQVTREENRFLDKLRRAVGLKCRLLSSGHTE